MLLLREVRRRRYTDGDLRDRKVFARGQAAAKGDQTGCLDVPGGLFEDAWWTLALATKVCLKVSALDLKTVIEITYSPTFGLKACHRPIS